MADATDHVAAANSLDHKRAERVESFSENISKLINSRDEFDQNVTIQDLFTDEVEVNFDEFGSCIARKTGFEAKARH